LLVLHSFPTLRSSDLSVTCTLIVPVTSLCNLTGTFVWPRARIGSGKSILRRSTVNLCCFFKVSAICLLVIEPNKRPPSPDFAFRSEEHTSELQSRFVL